MNDGNMKPIAVNFPLSGEWCAVNTPGEKVPSHGTDQLGQTYAYDFFQIDWSKKGYRISHKPLLRSILFGVALNETLCWSQPILAPFDGEVIEASDGLKERNPVHIVRDLLTVIKNGVFLNADKNQDLKCVLGNYIILKGQEAYCLIAHARFNSILVTEGQNVIEGEHLADVGHSGNSSAPHLHFQLMDRPDLLEAKGLPCCFKKLQVYEEGNWSEVNNYIPGKRVQISA